MDDLDRVRAFLEALGPGGLEIMVNFFALLLINFFFSKNVIWYFDFFFSMFTNSANS